MMFRREKREMRELDSKERTLIQNLKGRISKALGFRNYLTNKEEKSLLITYNVIDELLTSRHTLVETKKAFRAISSPLKETDKSFIRHHILPLMTKVSSREWGE